jgi:signal transduction histidine kinase
MTSIPPLSHVTRSHEGNRNSALDDIAAIAAKLLDAPIALITQVDSECVRWLGHSGDTAILEKETGLCRIAMMQDTPCVIEDASKDGRVCDHPHVCGEFQLRFYLGIPLNSRDGKRVGTLCVMDRVPRSFPLERCDVLKELCSIASEQLELKLSHETLLRETAETSKGLLEKDQLLLTAIHDLRTPLSTVTMLSSLLAEQQLGILNPGQQKMVNSICVACKDMANQLTEYAEFISVDPNQLRLERHPADLYGIVRDCIDQQQLRMTESMVQVHLNLENPLPPVSVDAPRIRRALTTFLNHSMLRSKSSDTVVVEVKPHDSHVMIRFTDQGPPLTPGQVDLLFNPSSANRGLKNHGPGIKEMGLTLPTAKRILEAHGGSLEVDVRSGSSVSFCLFLPLDVSSTHSEKCPGLDSNQGPID